MTTKIDSITSISIGEASVGTVGGGSSILASSTAFMNNLGFALNQAISYAITGTKTFATLILIDGLASLGTSLTTSIGTSTATTVNLLSSSNAGATVVLNGLTQPLQVSNAIDTWSRVIVVAPDQQSGIPNTKIITGSGSYNGFGTVIPFTPNFTPGCIPRVFTTSLVPGSQLFQGAYNVNNASWTQAGFGGFTLNWFAIGY
jgi:hypothetical protein